jgi:sarcosine oxidase subunit alpha
MAAGAEEPNGLIQLGAGARGEPNLRATEAELVDGLRIAQKQTRHPAIELPR